MLNEGLPNKTVEDCVRIAQRMSNLEYFVRDRSIVESENVSDQRGKRWPRTPILCGAATFRSVGHRSSDYWPTPPLHTTDDDCA